MALTDHIAILLGHSLDVARLNKKKTRADFYAQVAVPPAAAIDVAALVADTYPGVPLTSIEVNFKTNAQQDKPFVGVPSDWFILRMASQMAPELVCADGVTRVAHTEARSKFFAGMKVRVVSTAWAWKNDFGKSGASFNLNGLMDAGIGGERLQIGGGVVGNAFTAYGNPNATLAAAANPFSAPQTQQTQTVTPQQAQPAAAEVSANPFAQTAPTNTANPFAQA